MEVLAEVERSGFVESRHLGAVAVADADGRLLAGDGLPPEAQTLSQTWLAAALNAA